MFLNHRRKWRQAVHFPVMSPLKTSGKPGKASKTAKVEPAQDRAHDVLRSEPHPLDAIFAPRSVAVIGASDRAGSVGRAVLWSLVSSPFGGTVYPVSDKRSSVLGIKAYKSVADIARDRGSGGRDHARGDRARDHRRMRAGWRARRNCHLRRLQGAWRKGQGTRAPDSGAHARNRACD